MDYFFAILMAFIAIIYGIAVIIYIVSSIGELFIFRKSGVPGWQAFIPFLNTYRLCEITKTKDFFVWIIISHVAHVAVASTTEQLELEMLGGLLNMVCYIMQIWLTAVVYKRLAESFGYEGWGWVVLMILLTPIIFLIMGLNDTKYDEPLYELTVRDYIQQFKR